MRRVWLFLNNRYHDPLTGQFISVDPLVQQTGEPYIYASANPTTLSDPSGMCTDFVMDEDGNWACTFYTADDGSRSVDNHGGDFCNRGMNICSVDEGELPVDFVFGDQKPDKYKGIPTSLLVYEPKIDPFEAHRRGILQALGIGVSGLCIIGSGGALAEVCGPALVAVATANVAQSAEDNLLGEEACVGGFAIGVAANVTPFGLNAAAGSLAPEMVEGARALIGGTSMVGSQVSAIDVCAGG